ncbi:hypothetical protein CEXT_71561 [Caerostris extrusa]|uniref:Uncharacterized protein n=1 Tax=Caerostris extrusa TaxID=172846 RepID=A0AAV4XRJ0_CAEEX|nr:hypothetical protein CEXT_71561 [Caerostris extrusa]
MQKPPIFTGHPSHPQTCEHTHNQMSSLVTYEQERREKGLLPLIERAELRSDEEQMRKYGIKVSLWEAFASNEQSSAGFYIDGVSSPTPAPYITPPRYTGALDRSRQWWVVCQDLGYRKSWQL